MTSTSERPVAVVTGASRGLGFLLARALGRRGHNLVVCARSEDGLAAAEADLARTGVEVVTAVADVANREQADRLIGDAVARFGRLDMLVNNAGVIQVGPAVTMTHEQFADALDVMLWGAVNTSLAAVPTMRAQGNGRIVTISSVGGKLPAPHLLPYTTAKFAVTGFSEGLRAELAKYGITVTTVIPGLMRTGSPRNALFTGDRAAEYRWFAVADSLPLLSMDAERAAERIVTAAIRGRAEVVLTPAAKLGVLAHGVAPGLVSRMSGLVDRLLPGTEHAGPPRPGHEVTGRMSKPVQWLTALNRLASTRFHQHDDATSAQDG